MKEPKQRFVLNLKLDTEMWQEDILDKRFEILARTLVASAMS